MLRSGIAGGLDYDLQIVQDAPEPAPGVGSTVAILLHGRGSHKGDLQALRPALPADWVLLTPQAPFPGPPWGYGGGWAWYRYVQEDRLDEATLAQSLERLDALLSSLPDVLGHTPDRIVIGGFSQGGTTSLAYALSRFGTLAAVLNFSGFLAASVAVDEAAAARGAIPPIFWGHGTSDGNIPYALATKGRTRLAEAGLEVVARDYPIGHWLVPEEIQAAVDMVEQRTERTG